MLQPNSDRQIDRTVYFDYLRVVAILAVVFLHVSDSNWYTTDVNGLQWQTFNFFNGITRWGVPVFVMISGSLFLNREVLLKRMYSKYILRLVISYLIWAFIYALFIEGNIEKRIMAILEGHYHMWFIPMIIGLYMCVPLIRPIVQSENRIKYFLLLSFIFAFLIPETVTMGTDLGNEMIMQLMHAVNRGASSLYMHIVLGYTAYFILGYYLNQVKLDKKQRIVIYVLGLLGFAFTVGMNWYVASKNIDCSGHYSDNFNVNILFEAIAVFTFFKYREFDNFARNRFIQRLSKYSYGAYLVHALIIEQLDVRLGLNTMLFNPVFSMLCIGVIVYVLSFAISALLNLVPILKKYIV